MKSKLRLKKEWDSIFKSMNKEKCLKIAGIKRKLYRGEITYWEGARMIGEVLAD